MAVPTGGFQLVPFPWEGHPAAPALTAIYMHARKNVEKDAYTNPWAQDYRLVRAVKRALQRLHTKMFGMAQNGSSLVSRAYGVHSFLLEHLGHNATRVEAWAAIATVIAEPSLGSLFDIATPHAVIRATVLMLDDDERNLLLPALRAMRGFEL